VGCEGIEFDFDLIATVFFFESKKSLLNVFLKVKIGAECLSVQTRSVVRFGDLRP